MCTATIDEYLATSYEPECEFVDGRLVDRHTGLKTHSHALTHVMVWLYEHVSAYCVLPILRVRTSPTCIRVADVCVLSKDVDDEVPDTPPVLWVEILSPDDCFGPFQRKIDELLKFGVPTIWIVDPYERQAWIGTPRTGIVEAEGDVLRCEALNCKCRSMRLVPRRRRQLFHHNIVVLIEHAHRDQMASLRRNQIGQHLRVGDQILRQQQNPFATIHRIFRFVDPA
ncbi:MAG: Uma2 family endonuclease [Acidobacteriaceae bacterium]|nr:Uma2 family endonuclease [Acidobacteriaceae bacterium]